MRTSTGQPIRLADYRAPDYLIDAVELDVSLDRHATRVVSILAIRPNPAGRAGAALALDGDELKAGEHRTRWSDAGSRRLCRVSPEKLVLANPPQTTVQAAHRDGARSGRPTPS